MQSAQLVAAKAKSEAEEIRLLYVGMTRAKDCLILARRDETSKSDSLSRLMSADGKPIFRRAKFVGRANILDRPAEQIAFCTKFEASSIVEPHDRNSRKPAFILGRCNEFLPYRKTPSEERFSKDENSEVIISKVVDTLGPRLLSDNCERSAELGRAVHKFIAIDDRSLSINGRLSLAHEILEDFGCSVELKVELLKSSDRLYATLNELFADAVWYREWPVCGKINNQRISGVIDLLLEVSEGFVVIDHKTFPGPFDSWNAKAVSCFPQLNLYAELVGAATKKRVICTYIHFPLLGKLIQLSRRSEPPLKSAEGFFVI